MLVCLHVSFKVLQSMGVHGNWQIYVGCWTFTGGWYSCSVDIHPEGAEGVYLYYLCGICSRFACYVCFFSFRTLISQSIMKMICAFFLILIGIFSFLLPYILACLCHVFILTAAGWYSR